MSGTARRPIDEVILSERVRQRTLATRRRRFVRSALLFVCLAAAMVIISLVHRDAQAVRQCRDRMEYAARKFSADYKYRNLRPVLPYRKADAEWMARHYDYAYENDQYFGPDRQVGVCCCKRAHRLSLRPDGRHVILFDGQNFQLVWMTEDEFQRRAEALHLPVPDEQ